MIEKSETYIAGTYSRFPVEIVSGRGSVVYGQDGKKYIDLTSGIGVNAFGVSDSLWAQAVTKQVSLVQHTSNLYYTEPCSKLAEMLCIKTGMKKVFFANSGAEANECAVKTARKYASEKKGAEFYEIITLVNSFHGRTITTLAATGQEHYHKLFQPLTPGFVHTPANDVTALEETVKRHKTAAIMLECIQGEGGVVPLTEEFVLAAAEIAAREDILLIADEVQTGNGRTGELYAYMNYGVKPDIITTAKGLGGGLPIGAVIFGEKTQNVLGRGDHGSTFGGNPVCCAGALSVLERLDAEFLANVKKKSKTVFEALKNATGVESVTGMGLMIGIKTVKPASEVIGKCIENGVLCLSAKDKVRLLPALNIPDDILDQALKVITGVCAD